MSDYAIKDGKRTTEFQSCFGRFRTIAVHFFSGFVDGDAIVTNGEIIFVSLADAPVKDVNLTDDTHKGGVHIKNEKTVITLLGINYIRGGIELSNGDSAQLEITDKNGGFSTERERLPSMEGR